MPVNIKSFIKNKKTAKNTDICTLATQKYKKMLEDSYRHKGLRRKLVEELRQKGIQDEQVLEAIGQIPRHWFLDSAFLEHAYEDKAFAIGEGQTISQPYTVAFQSELLQVQARDRLLEVGTGSAYQACVLALLGAKVYSIEYKEGLFRKAQKMVQMLGLERQIQLFLGDGSQGLPTYAPFKGILVTAGAPEVPQSLLEQLSTKEGRLVIPVGDAQSQKMYCIKRQSETAFVKEVHESFSFVPLLGKFGWKSSS